MQDASPPESRTRQTTTMMLMTKGLVVCLNDMCAENLYLIIISIPSLAGWECGYLCRPGHRRTPSRASKVQYGWEIWWPVF